MPRYYFHLYQGSNLIAQDEAGYECVDDEEARQFARLSKGLVALDPFLSGWPEHRFEVLNEAGRRVLTLPIPRQRTSARSFKTAGDANLSLAREGRARTQSDRPATYGIIAGR